MKWEDAIEEIKRRTDIAQLVGRTVKLKRSGRHWMGLCPFHTEKTPSFSVSPEGFYKCFGCGASGDIFTFLEKQTGKLFADIVKDFAQEYGLSLDEKTSSVKAERTRGLLEALAIVKGYFHRKLLESKEALSYLKERGLEQQTIERFELGYAGGNDRELFDFLKKEGLSAQLAEQVGLIKRGKTGWYGFFSHRLMFPISDARGQVCAFGGRIIGDHPPNRPKYLNSPASEIYDKSSIFYGLSQSLPLLKQGNPAVIVEGYFDAIAVIESGYPGLAPCGTSITEQQVGRLHAYSEQAILCFDEDKAGKMAAQKALMLFLAEGFEVRKAALALKDPGEFIRLNKKGELAQTLEASSDALEALIVEASQQIRGVSSRIGVIDSLIPFLGSIKRPLVRNQYVRLCAKILGEDEKLLMEEVAKLRPFQIEEKKKALEEAIQQRVSQRVVWSEKERLAFRVLWLYPKLIHNCSEKWIEKQNSFLKDFCWALKEQTETNEMSAVEALKKLRSSLTTEILFLIQEIRRHALIVSQEEAADVLKGLQEELVFKERQKVLGNSQKALREAFSAGDLEKVRQLLEEQATVILEKGPKRNNPPAEEVKPSLVVEKKVTKHDINEWEDEGWY